MATNDTIPVGLTLPLQRGANGYFAQNFNTLDAARDNIKNLLLTMTSERRMNTSFGSPIYRILFEQITPDTEEELTQNLTESIQNLLNIYFPYVDVLNIDISYPENNQQQVDFKITFRLKNSSNIEFGVSETRTVNLSINANV